MVLDHDGIRRAMTAAWRRSEPNGPQAHEEGGFVVLGLDGTPVVIGWPRGLQNEIFVPAHRGGRIDNLPILATFHTHPNSGLAFRQEPSLTDIRAVRDDPDLSNPDYEGEYVISRSLVYRILRTGDVIVVGETQTILKLPEIEA